MTDIDSICYLCGCPLLDADSDDHVPPKCFFGSSIRKKHGPNLLTLKVHAQCNASYKDDEEYFMNSIAPLAIGSYSANSVWQDLKKGYLRPQGKRLGEMILREYDLRPGALVLPFNKVAKRFDGQRVRRVLWKITRGLFFHEYSSYLPENLPRNIELVSVGEKPPEQFALVADAPTKGLYPAVFDFRYIEFPEFHFHVWAFLLWDNIITIMMFHDPACDCEDCTARRQDAG